MPQVDNLHAAEVLLGVLPSERRRAVGRLLVGDVDRRARAHGRDTLVGFADEPPVGDHGSAVRAAAAALGWQVVQGLSRSDRRRGFQWGTTGLLVKLVALQELSARSPASRLVSTWNAQGNTPMIAVNEALGARTNGAVLALQRKLT